METPKYGPMKSMKSMESMESYIMFVASLYIFEHIRMNISIFSKHIQCLFKMTVCKMLFLDICRSFPDMLLELLPEDSYF